MSSVFSTTSICIAFEVSETKRNKMTLARKGFKCKDSELSGWVFTAD